jgi:hypothetical protein
MHKNGLKFLGNIIPSEKSGAFGIFGGNRHVSLNKYVQKYTNLSSCSAKNGIKLMI